MEQKADYQSEFLLLISRAASSGQRVRSDGGGEVTVMRFTGEIRVHASRLVFNQTDLDSFLTDAKTAFPLLDVTNDENYFDTGLLVLKLTEPVQSQGGNHGTKS